MPHGPTLIHSFILDTEDDAENEKETGVDQEKEDEHEQEKEDEKEKEEAKEEDLEHEPVPPITEYVEAAEHSCKVNTA